MKGDSAAGNGTCSSCGRSGSGNGNGNGHNNDKAIARLLYAMLKQKCLKDIDWNRVACDPVLLEEISNGHAARMRFSRFRTTAENQGKKRQTRLSGGPTPSVSSTASTAAFRVSKSRRDTRDTRVGKHIAGLEMKTSRKQLSDVMGEDPAALEEERELSPQPPSPPAENMIAITQSKRGDRPAGPGRPLAHIKTESQPFGVAAQVSPQLFSTGHALTRNFSSSSAPEMLEMPPYYPRFRDLTPCSDDQNGPEVSAAPSTDAFRLATAASATTAAAHYGNGGGSLALTPPWMSATSLPTPHAPQPMLSCPPFSPPLGIYDMATTLDTAGFADNNFCPGNLPQQPQTTQGSMHITGYVMGHPGMAVFRRHDDTWDTLLGHGNDVNQHHGI